MQPLYGAFRFCFRPTIINNAAIPASGGTLVAGNHVHALDPILVGACTKRQVHSLAKKELHDGPLGFFFRAVGTIPIDLYNKANRASMDIAEAKLEAGALIGISPEAKRNYTSELLLPFKFGTVVMAQKTNSVIVPYAITGRYKLFSKGLAIKFGEPFTVGTMSLEEANELLFEKVKALLLELRGEEKHP